MPNSYVYVIRDDFGRRKIGVALDPLSRVKDLQVGNASELVVEYSFKLKSNRAAYKTEQLSHKALTAMGSRVRGEWFNVEPLFARKVVEQAAKELRHSCALEINNPDHENDLPDEQLSSVLANLYGSSEKTCIICDERAEYRYSGEQHGEDIRESQRWLCCDHFDPYKNDPEWSHLPDQIVPDDEKPQAKLLISKPLIG